MPGLSLVTQSLLTLVIRMHLGKIERSHCRTHVDTNIFNHLHMWFERSDSKLFWSFFTYLEWATCNQIHSKWTGSYTCQTLWWWLGPVWSLYIFVDISVFQFYHWSWSRSNPWRNSYSLWCFFCCCVFFQSINSLKEKSGVNHHIPVNPGHQRLSVGRRISKNLMQHSLNNEGAFTLN